MTQDELLQELSPIRLPISYAEFTAQDALLALSLGLIGGLIIAKLVGLVTTRSVGAHDLAQTRIKALSKLDPDQRLLGLAELLGEYAPEQLRKLKAGNSLYDPTRHLDPAEFEAAILNATKRGAR